MVHYITLYKLKPEINGEMLDDMLRSSRTQLLRIPEANNVRTGKKIDEECEWPFFVAVDFDTRDRMEMYKDDPIYAKFLKDVITPHTAASLELVYEMEPGKDVKYS